MTMQELYDLLDLELHENSYPPDTPVILRVNEIETEIWDAWYRNIKHYHGMWQSNTFVIEDAS